MSALAVHQLYPPLTRSVNTGSSPESRKLEARFKEIIAHFRSRAERDRAFAELGRAISAGQKADWDRYGAVEVGPRVGQLACRFLNVLPSTIPAPEVGLDPDGEVSFAWIVSRDRQLNVSLSPEGILSYAGAFGPVSSVHGTEQFDDAVPGAIVEAIRRLGIAG